jgi:hypothetical protein
LFEGLQDSPTCLSDENISYKTVPMDHKD